MNPSLALLVLALTACAPASAAVAVTPDTTSTTTVLASLPVKGKAPMAGYSRAQFGPTWTGTDATMRNDVLARDMSDETFKPGTHNCVVLTGTRTTRTRQDDRVPARAGHQRRLADRPLVSLGDAWATGAQQLTAAERERLANGPSNPLAVDGPTNQGKGDNDASGWLPPNKAFRCDYVSRQVALKKRYGCYPVGAVELSLRNGCRDDACGCA